MSGIERLHEVRAWLIELERTDPEVAAAARRLDTLDEQLEAMGRARSFAERVRAKRNGA